MTKKTGTRNVEIGCTKLFEAAIAAVHEVLEMHVLQNESGRVGADDGGQSDDRREIGQAETEHQRRRQKNPVAAQARRETKHPRREIQAEDERPDQKRQRLSQNQGDPDVGQRATGAGRRDHAGDDGEDHQSEDVINDRRTQDDSRLSCLRTGRGRAGLEP